MHCYYSNRDCKKCGKKLNCTILREVKRLTRDLESAEMRLDPPEHKGVLSK